MAENITARYAALVTAGEVEGDDGQAHLVDHLADLVRRLDERRLAR
jgi:hypothetical protein